MNLYQEETREGNRKRKVHVKQTNKQDAYTQKTYIVYLL